MDSFQKLMRELTRISNASATFRDTYLEFGLSGDINRYNGEVASDYKKEARPFLNLMADEGSSGTILARIEQRESEAKNSRQEQYEGIGHEMESGEKIPQAIALIFREGDKVTDSLKASIVQIEEPAV
ncbi:hypothetical protein FNV43_RR16910 [Rhamnella rubrinervis]|uniref:Uncharacterized protein n=1 Tax=Rhamnella rubrinervis TaxID=2594499 RepID=A0A8K0GZM6_9ROSA|nr:hypothetical protein FNV43_RR16910 [Rhamnella rubrinervis]